VRDSDGNVFIPFLCWCWSIEITSTQNHWKTTAQTQVLKVARSFFNLYLAWRLSCLDKDHSFSGCPSFKPENSFSEYFYTLFSNFHIAFCCKCICYFT
jgi:hypothetical protein